jgi:hypothetical protein
LSLETAISRTGIGSVAALVAAAVIRDVTDARLERRVAVRGGEADMAEGDCSWDGD